jgi:hypothetical protein
MALHLLMVCLCTWRHTYIVRCTPAQLRKQALAFIGYVLAPAFDLRLVAAVLSRPRVLVALFCSMTSPSQGAQPCATLNSAANGCCRSGQLHRAGTSRSCTL